MKCNFTFQVGPDGPLLALDAPVPVSSSSGEADKASAARRRDAVVDAARTLEDLSVEGVRRFVTQRWSGRRALEESDVESFASDARAQRVEDVVDALDSRVRQSALAWGSRHVKVEMPRGWLRASLRAMNDAEKAVVLERLDARGWDEKTLSRALKTFRSEFKKVEG
jgi:hypothetical protein